MVKNAVLIEILEKDQVLALRFQSNAKRNTFVGYILDVLPNAFYVMKENLILLTSLHNAFDDIIDAVGQFFRGWNVYLIKNKTISYHPVKA